MKVLFDDFIRDFVDGARVIPGSYMVARGDFPYQLPMAACHFDKVEKVMNGAVGDILEYNGARFTVFGDYLVSDKPFNVTGFAGCMDDFIGDFKQSIEDDLSFVKRSIESWHCVSFGLSGRADRGFPVSIDDIARRFCVHWVKKAYDYVRFHSEYNLVGDNFPEPGIDELIAGLFGIRNFYHRFERFDDLDKLVDTLDFRKMLGWLEREFDEDKLNAEFLGNAAKELCKPYVDKQVCKAHDNYKVQYWRGGWQISNALHGSEIDDWLSALMALCKNQGLMEFGNGFLNDFREFVPGLNPGDSVTCKGCKVRIHKENITISLPKKISVAMGVFINKYNPDALREMVA